MKDLSCCPSQLESLAKEVGKFIQYWGFKTIHGRIWTHIYLSNEPLDAGTLMRRLQVSKALMSLSLNDLLEYNVIQEAGKSTKGTQTYVANPNVLDVIFSVLSRREQAMLKQIELAGQELGGMLSEALAESSICSNRLQAFRTMVQQAQGALTGILALGTLNMKPWEIFNERKSAE